jgi:hypothetical protein
VATDTIAINVRVPSAWTAHDFYRFHVLERVPAARVAADLDALHSALKLDGIPALIAYVGGYLAEAGERVDLAAVRAGRFRAVSPSRPSMMLICTTPTTAPRLLQRNSTSLSSTAAMMRPEQSTPLIPCGTTGIKPVSSSLNS